MTPRTRGLALIPGVALGAALVVGAPLLGAPTAFAAETDISVTYSTQNAADAPIDGSSTVHGRVGQLRDDMQVTYTIQSDTVQYPIPVLTYTGDFTDSSDATYTFRFGCDGSVPGSDCATYQPQVDAMNGLASALDGRSIEGFTADVTPIIMAFGGNVPPGITGTVTASILSDVPGTGQLEFFLQEGEQAGAERLSPTAITPLSITEPSIAATSTGSFCAADLAEYTEGKTKYTPTGFGRADFDIQSTVTDAGILPDDATPVGTTADGVVFSVQNGGTGLTEAGVEAELLAAPAGTYQVADAYTAPDGVPARGIGTEVTVLGADAPECYSASEIVDPVDPVDPKPTDPKPTDPKPVQTLANTGSGDSGVLAGAGAALLGALLLGRALLRRRAA